jgi:hypothetical protein
MTENPITETPTADSQTAEDPTPATESETAEDLLARIKRETQERLKELSAAVEESRRLRAELKELEAQPEPEPPSNVIRLPAAPGAPLDEADEEVEPYERAS